MSSASNNRLGSTSTLTGVQDETLNVESALSTLTVAQDDILELNVDKVESPLSYVTAIQKLQSTFLEIDAYLSPFIEEDSRVTNLGRNHWLQEFLSLGTSIQTQLANSVQLSYYGYMSTSRWCDHFSNPLSAELAHPVDSVKDVSELRLHIVQTVGDLTEGIKAMEEMLVSHGGGKLKDGSHNTAQLREGIRVDVDFRFAETSPAEARALLIVLCSKFEGFLSFEKNVNYIDGYWKAMQLFTALNTIKERQKEPLCPQTRIKHLKAFKKQQRNYLNYILGLRPLLQTNPKGYLEAITWVSHIEMDSNERHNRRDGLPRLPKRILPGRDQYMVKEQGTPFEYNMKDVLREPSILIFDYVWHQKPLSQVLNVSASIRSVTWLGSSRYQIKVLLSLNGINSPDICEGRCTYVDIHWSFYYPRHSDSLPAITGYAPSNERFNPSSVKHIEGVSYTFAPAFEGTGLGEISKTHLKEYGSNHHGQVQGCSNNSSVREALPNVVRWRFIENRETKQFVDSCLLGVELSLRSDTHVLFTQMHAEVTYETRRKGDHLLSRTRMRDTKKSLSGFERKLDLPLFSAAAPKLPVTTTENLSDCGVILPDVA